MKQENLNLLLLVLNRLEVKGENNLNDLLAAIQITKQLIAEVKNNGMDSNRSSGRFDWSISDSGKTHSSTHPTDTKDIGLVE